MDVNSKNYFSSKSEELIKISFDPENLLQKESPNKFKRNVIFPESIGKEKNNIFTSEIKKKNIIPNSKEVKKNKNKTLFGDLFMNNKESDLSKIFTNEENSIKMPYIEDKGGDLFGNNNIINKNK